MENTNLTLTDLHLSKRASNVLKLREINTLEDLCNITEEELVKFRNCGRKTANEIIWRLEDLGLHLRKPDKVKIKETFDRYEAFRLNNISNVKNAKISSNGYDIFIDGYRIDINSLYCTFDTVKFDILMLRALKKVSYNQIGRIMGKSKDYINHLYLRTLKIIKVEYFLRFLFLCSIKDDLALLNNGNYESLLNNADKCILSLFEEYSIDIKKNVYDESFWNVYNIHTYRKILDDKSLLNFYVNYLSEIYPFDDHFMKRIRLLNAESILDITEDNNDLDNESNSLNLDDGWLDDDLSDDWLDDDWLDDLEV